MYTWLQIGILKVDTCTMQDVPVFYEVKCKILKKLGKLQNLAEYIEVLNW